MIHTGGEYDYTSVSPYWVGVVPPYSSVMPTPRMDIEQIFSEQFRHDKGREAPVEAKRLVSSSQTKR